MLAKTFTAAFTLSMALLTTASPTARLQSRQSVSFGDPQCSSADPPLVTGDCLIAFGDSPLGSAVDNSPFDIGIDGFSASFGSCTILVQFFDGDESVATTVGELDLANAVEALFGGTQNENCQVAISANGLSGTASDFNPLSL